MQVQRIDQSEHRPMGSDEMSLSQQHAVNYFFTQLKVTDPHFVNTSMPSEQAEYVVKRTYASHIMNFTQSQIDQGFAGYRMAKQEGSEKFTSIDAAIGYIKRGGQPPESESEHCAPAGIYKPFVPDNALPDLAAEERSRAENQKFKAQFSDWFGGGNDSV